MDIMRVTDVALKATDVKPGMLIVERLYGMLEIHSDRRPTCGPAGRAILDMLGLREEERLKPEISSSQVIRNISPYHTQLINRTRHGDMIMPGQSLYVIECAPAAYAALAANEAEKAAHINVLEVRAFGRFGRVYLGGEERDIDVGVPGGGAAIESVEGRKQEKQSSRGLFWLLASNVRSNKRSCVWLKHWA